MADPRHPRHYDETFKRQIVQLYESGKPSRKIRRRGPDILRTIELGCSNARFEASDNRIKVTIRTAYGFHHANNLIALVMLPLRRTRHTPTTAENLTHENSRSLICIGHFCAGREV